jgi:hypothetical protein
MAESGSHYSDADRKFYSNEREAMGVLTHKYSSAIEKITTSKTSAWSHD